MQTTMTDWPTLFPMKHEDFLYSVERYRNRRKQEFRRLTHKEVQDLGPIPGTVYSRWATFLDEGNHVWDQGGDALKRWTEVVNGDRHVHYCHHRQCMVIE